jgi:hypothetical protein
MHIITQRPKKFRAECSCGQWFAGKDYVKKVLKHINPAEQSNGKK